MTKPKGYNKWLRLAQQELGLTVPNGVTSPSSRPPEKTDVSTGATCAPPPPEKFPVCADCGGRPNLGRQRGDEIVSLCHDCAEQDYLSKLTPEKRALLR